MRLDRLLQQLSAPRRVLMIGAHPDDEDTQLLAYLARGKGVDAAYLSLSRGDGGQDLLGPQLGIELGLIRSEELLSARQVDGAHQFFTRAFDFGFTRSLPETEGFWPPDSVLKDVVRVVRRFRPQVIVAVFTGTPRDGHGQHQMSGVMAPKAFAVAGDPSVYPELASQEGLAPWKPLKLYRETYRDPKDATLTLPSGRLDPRTGQTYHQIAMASRSEHESQGMGRLQQTGPSVTHLKLLVNDTGQATDTAVFQGIPRDDGWVGSFADSLRRELSAPHLADAAAPLAAALKRFETAGGGPTLDTARTHRLLSEALGVASGIVIDARASSDELIPGQPFSVDLQVYDAGSTAIRYDSTTFERHVAGWSDAPQSVAVTPQTIAAGDQMTTTVTDTLPAAAQPTQPYFLKAPMNGFMYNWSKADPSVRGLPFGPPPIIAAVHLTVRGVPVTLRREVSYRYDDRAQGELRSPLRVVPAIGVKLDPADLLWPASGPRTHEFTVALTYHGAGAVSGKVSLSVDGWTAPAPQSFAFAHTGEMRTLTFTVHRPAAVRDASVAVSAAAKTTDGRTFDQWVDLISYPHIRSVQWVRPAAGKIRVAPIAMPPLRAVGYVRGAADRVPEALKQIGLPLTLLDAQALATGDLSRYDAIIIGSRAYQVDTALTEHNNRLLDYVRNGGLLLVQYQQYPFIRGNYAPYSLTIARPHDRVTDETVPVKILAPNDPAFTTPNKIGPSDWDGWPQERGLYFAHTWDPAYHPLLEMHDPGMPPLEGGLLVARVGKGTYIYTGLSFFRALPADVPGAYRLFLNLLGRREASATR